MALSSGARRYSPAGQLKYVLTGAANHGDAISITALGLIGVIISGNAGEAFASGDEVIVECECPAQWEYPTALTTQAVGADVDVDNSTGAVVADTTGDVGAVVTKAFTTGDGTIVVAFISQLA